MSGPLSDLAEPSNNLLKLRDNVAYRNLWLAATISDLGTEISTIAIPLVAVITLRASNVKVGLLASAQTVPFLLFSLPVGVWVDRIRKKLLMVGADIARAVLLLSVPVAFWLGGLTIWQLYGVVFAVACFTVCFKRRIGLGQRGGRRQMGLGLVKARPRRVEVGGHGFDTAVAGEVGHAYGRHRLLDSNRDEWS